MAKHYLRALSSRSFAGHTLSKALHRLFADGGCRTLIKRGKTLEARERPNRSDLSRQPAGRVQEQFRRGGANAISKSSLRHDTNTGTESFQGLSKIGFA